MDVDSLLCLNSDEKKSFELLKLENKKSLNKILENLEKSIDCVVQDTGEDLVGFNYKNLNSETDSSAAAFGQLINVVSSTLADLKISEKNKTHFHQNECEELISLSDKNQDNFKIPDKNASLQREMEISSRYPELFEIFSENSLSQFSNFSLNSEFSNENNFTRHFTDEKPEKFIETSLWEFEDQHGISSKKLTSKIIEDIVPEKLSPGNLPINSQISKDESGQLYLDNLDPVKESVSKLSKNPIQVKMKVFNCKNRKETKIPIKRKKCDEEGYNHENQSSSKIKKISSSLENLPPLSSTSVFSSRTHASNSSLNSWITLRDTPRNKPENYSSEFSFSTRSVHDFENGKKLKKSEGKRERLKTGDRNKVKKKKKKFSSNLETVQGDSAVKENRILSEKSAIQMNVEKKEIEKRQKVSENQIFINVIDILVGVRSTLFENRRLVESIQKHFQTSSIFHTIISDDSIALINEGISRCALRVQNKGKNQELFIGANELLMDSILNLMKFVKEEKEYLKQQEYYYSKRFLSLTKDDRCFGNSKRNTKHTLTENTTLLSSSQKTKIEELITYSVSLIKKIIPKNSTMNNPSKKSPERCPLSDVKIKRGQVEIVQKSKEYDLNFKNNNFLTDFMDRTESIKSDRELEASFIKPSQLGSSKIINKNPNEKLTRCPTMVLQGNSNNNSKYDSCQIIKATNKGRFCNNSQPIWKPAGNVKIPIHQLSRQNTRILVPALDKKKKKQTDELIKISSNSRNIETKQSSFPSYKFQTQNSSTNLKSSDLVEDPNDIKCSMDDKKMENSVTVNLETRECNLILKSQEEKVRDDNSTDLKRDKRKSKHPEAIKMLKELINSNSKEDIKFSKENKNISKDFKSIESDSEVSVHYLKFRNKLDSSRSSLASSILTKPEKPIFSSSEEINLRKSNRLEKSLRNCQRSKNYLSTFLARSKKSLNLEIHKTNFENEISLAKDSVQSKRSSDRLINSARSINSDNLINPARLIKSARSIDSKSTILVEGNKIEDKRNEVLNSVKSHDSKTNLERKESRKYYLRKNANNSSYLESYVRMNSRQSLASNYSCKSLKEKSELKSEKSKTVVPDSKTEIGKDNKANIESNSISESKNSIKVDQNISPRSSQSLPKVSSSKYCQVSFEPSSSSKNSDMEEVFEIEVNSLGSKDRFSEIITGNKDQDFKEYVKKLLQEHGVNLDSAEDTGRKSLKSIFLDDGKGNIVAIYSSKTLFDKLTSLSNSSIEELKIKNSTNQCSLESLDQGAKILESHEYSQNSGISLKSQNVLKSKNSTSIYSTDKKNVSLLAPQKIDSPSQTDSCPNESEECQTAFVKSAETTTEKISFKNLVDKKVSCSLENVAVSKSEKSTEISFNCEVESQTEISPRNSANIAQILEENTNKNLLIKENILEITKITDNKNSDLELKNVNLNKSKEEFSLIDTVLGEEINQKKNTEEGQKIFTEGAEEISAKNFNEKENTGKNCKNLDKVKKHLSPIDSNPEEKANREDSKQEEISEMKIKICKVAEENAKEKKFIHKAEEQFFSENTILEKSKSNEDLKESKTSSIFENDYEQKSQNLHEDKEESFDLILNFEKQKDQFNFAVDTKLNVKAENKPEEKSSRFNKYSGNSESSFKLKKKVSCSSHEQRFKKHLKTIVKKISNKSETLLKETMESVQENKSSISDDSISEFKSLSVKIPRMKLIENSDTKIPVAHYSLEEFKNLKLKSELKFVPSLVACWVNKNETRDLRKANKAENSENRENCVDLEKFFQDCKKIDNFFQPRKKAQKCKSCGKKRRVVTNFGDNSLQTVIKGMNNKIEKIRIDTPRGLAQSLAVETLKMATKRAQNLYNDVVLCRECLTSRKSRNLNQLELSSESNSLKETNFLTLDNLRIKSKTLRRVLGNFRKMPVKEDLCLSYNSGNVGDKKIDKFQLGHATFSTSFQIIFILCFLTFLLYLSI